jgi:hypothetical protein
MKKTPRVSQGPETTGSQNVTVFESVGRKTSETFSIRTSVDNAPHRLSHSSGTNESRDDVDDLLIIAPTYPRTPT